MESSVISGKVKAFLDSPQGQAAIRALLAPSGIVGLWLVKWGFPGTDLGWVTDIIIQATPFVISFVWSLAEKTHRAIIAQAAKILADRQQGTIIIKQGAVDGAAAAVADPALKNVVSAGSSAAFVAANDTTPVNPTK